MAKRPAEHLLIDMSNVDVSFDADAFDNLLRSQGVRLAHYRAMPCPVGKVDLGDLRRPHPHHENCSNGFIYTKIGTIVAFMNSNSKSKKLEDVGFVDHSSISVTFPRNYEDCDEEFIITPFDRFYLDEEAINVGMWQLFMHHESGIDRLKFPVVKVQGPIVDARGERFINETDFKICNGQIEWTGRRPAPIVDGGPGLSNGFSTDRGAVCSIRYLYRPYWYVGAIPHEIRVTQIQDPIENTRTLTRMPQMAVLHREYVALDIAQDQEAPAPSGSDELRRILGPMYGGFGPK